MPLPFKADPPHFFPHRVCCNGCIPDEPAAVALWYYFLMAMQAWDTQQNQLPLEGEPDYIAPFERLYRVSAELYGCDINQMERFWLQVDLEVMRLNQLQMERGNFSKAHMIKTLPERLRMRNGPPSMQNLDVKPNNPDKWKLPDA